MTKEEFKAWQALTKSSETRWTLDIVQAHNHGTAFFYKGGENGVYISVTQDGLATMGTYEMAVPHIGDALFHQQHSKQLDLKGNDAIQFVLEKCGVPFLMDIWRLR